MNGNFANWRLFPIADDTDGEPEWDRALRREDLRMECLALAVEAKAADAVQEAKRYMAFVTGETAA